MLQKIPDKIFREKIGKPYKYCLIKLPTAVCVAVGIGENDTVTRKGILMLEVVFSDSAAGSLKLAQSYGKGEFLSPAIAVFVNHPDGRAATEQELKEARKNAEERERLAWNRAVPMEGSVSDIFSFPLAYSVGDITEDGIGEKRLKVLNCLFEIYGIGDSTAKEIYTEAVEGLRKIRDRLYDDGETVRLWYSDQPDEMCGLYWFMSQLGQWQITAEKIFTVKLPSWEYSENQDVVRKNSWGEVLPGEWYQYLPMQKIASSAFINSCVSWWKTLKEENAPLRVVLNGQLVSAPEDIYDSFIVREISIQDNEFQEAMVIGNIIGKYQLGVGDAWIAKRIEKMIEAGKLECVTEPLTDSPLYHRTLKKKFNQ